MAFWEKMILNCLFPKFKEFTEVGDFQWCFDEKWDRKHFLSHPLVISVFGFLKSHVKRAFALFFLSRGSLGQIEIHKIDHYQWYFGEKRWFFEVRWFHEIKDCNGLFGKCWDSGSIFGHNKIEHFKWHFGKK